MASRRKIIVGIFLVGGFLLFAFGLFLIGDRRQLFSESIELYAEFRNVSALKAGAPIRVSGMDAGEVQEITVPGGPEGKFRLRLRVLEKFRPILRADSVVTIQTDGLVGNKILAIGPGTAQTPAVEPGATLPSREPFEFADLMQQASDSVESANRTMDEIRKGINESVETLSGMGTDATELIRDVGDQVQKITVSGNKIAQQVSTVIDGVQAGEGTIGKLLKDDQLYTSIKSTVNEVEQTAENLKQTSEGLSQTISQVKSGQIVENLEQSVENVRDVTARAKEALAELKPKEGAGPGLTGDLRQTIANAREATADLSDNMEAMKRNWLFRGFFKERGFYDAKDVSLEEYQSGKFAPGFSRERQWLHENELFTVGPDGDEQLSEAGKNRINEAMAGFLRYMPKAAVIVEGYAAKGSAVEQALKSRERSLLVRKYLIEKFALKPNYVGALAMGTAEAPVRTGEPWEGVAIVVFLERKQAELQTDPEMLVPKNNGWAPKIGGLPGDAGFTLGAEAWQTSLAGGFVNAGVLALASVKKYEHIEAFLGAPRIANGRLFAALAARYRNYPEENFFGLGPDSSKNERTDFRLEDVNYTATFGVRPFSRMRAGVAGGVLDVNTGPGRDKEYPSTEQLFSAAQVPGLGLQPDYWHLGAFVEYDSRDSPSDPRSGGLYSFRMTHYEDRDFNRLSFGRYEIDLRQFFAVRDRRDVIAVRGILSLSGVGADQQVPFFLQPTVGGVTELRGFQQYRFRDNNALALSLEYRRPLYPFLDLVVFGDAGKVFARTTHLALNGLEGSAGAGGRIRLGEQVLLGADLAWSREGTRFWFRGAHTF
jgi:phospholipid/cholesterol/gamma-HCH transport system substrate-binding protein